MRLLQLGPAELQAIVDLIAEAARHVTDYATMLRIHEASKKGAAAVKAIRDMNSPRTIGIPDGFSCTYTQEEHRPGVVCRHLSIAVQSATAGPNHAAVRALMMAFEFKNTLEGCVVWLEDLPEGGFAVNLVEPLDGDMSRVATEGPAR